MTTPSDLLARERRTREREARRDALIKALIEQQLDPALGPPTKCMVTDCNGPPWDDDDQ